MNIYVVYHFNNIYNTVTQMSLLWIIALLIVLILRIFVDTVYDENLIFKVVNG